MTQISFYTASMLLWARFAGRPLDQDFNHSFLTGRDVCTDLTHPQTFPEKYNGGGGAFQNRPNA